MTSLWRAAAGSCIGPARIMTDSDPSGRPHRRYDPLSGRHILVSPHRTARPWSGASEEDEPAAPAFDPACHLCPGALRASGVRNPDYSGVFVFDNDFPAVEGAGPEGPRSTDTLFGCEPVAGEARVICFSPNHSKSMAELSVPEIQAVIDAWCDEARRLGERYGSVQIFENKGAAMGCSNPHPHGQIWATNFIPDEVAREGRNQAAWQARHGRSMLGQLAEREMDSGERVVVATTSWLIIVPFWATWPFETLLLPRFPIARLQDLEPDARVDLALALKRLTVRYDNLFETSFPYSMGWHGAPNGEDPSGWRLHAHFYPPLLRSASIRKFMVGFEMLAEAQRDLTPEKAAERLRAVGEMHYSGAEDG